MNYIKRLSEFQLNHFEIESICDQYLIKRYTINSDGTIDVDDDVDMSFNEFKQLPIKFNIVNGDFDCSDCELTTLKGCPNIVTGFFDCSRNKLKSLDGCPKQIGTNFICDSNRLTSLKGCPSKVRYLYCYDNKLTSLKWFPEVEMDIYYPNNRLPKEILNNDDYLKEIIKYQEDYNIWNPDNTLNINRFNMMMEEIKGI